MRVLVVDTALGLCTAGVFEVGGAGARALGLRSEPMAKGHSERLAGFARDAMAEAGLGFGAIDRIGVTVGPGSFTGLRVGLAFAQGLGAALDRPVVGVSALDALAASAGAAPAVAALIDARRGQVYARFWTGGEPEGPAEALTLDAAAARIAAMEPGDVLVGSGAALFAGAAVGATILALEGPTPEVLARLAATADPGLAPPRPLYLRPPDAVPPSRLPGQPRAGRAAGPDTAGGDRSATAARLAGLHAAAFPTPWSAGAFQSLLDQPGVFAVERRDGFILIRAVAGEAEILTLAVRPAARRRGLGGRLVGEGAVEAAARGATRLFLEVAADNAAARALYAQAGFAEAGRRPGYYAGPDGARRDALLLALNLTAPLP